MGGTDFLAQVRRACATRRGSCASSYSRASQSWVVRNFLRQGWPGSSTPSARIAGDRKGILPSDKCYRAAPVSGGGALTLAISESQSARRQPAGTGRGSFVQEASSKRSSFGSTLSIVA